jgi:hypothetical protein
VQVFVALEGGAELFHYRMLCNFYAYVLSRRACRVASLSGISTIKRLM